MVHDKQPFIFEALANLLTQFLVSKETTCCIVNIALTNESILGLKEQKQLRKTV